MNYLKFIDLAQLDPTTTEANVRAACDLAVANECASVCVYSSFVSVAVKYLETKLPVCSVVGFPSGFVFAKQKRDEALRAIGDGAQEIDYVVNRQYIKERSWAHVAHEMDLVVGACTYRGVICKAILETCYLTDLEIVQVCGLAINHGVDFVKTSTGFGSAGATEAAVNWIRETVSGKCGVKASGGIKTRAVAERFLELGCTRLGIGAASLRGILNEK